ncbi:hypothetical protein LJ207_10260 [Halanaerobium sp. Z-7514]|uniref:Uncharacterized protein n=1 Tax=Halanaerobium polyolivorans TaxID=2886943 RepID=A0AAW4X1K4_9FIRM|nr:hypothetical protein [Halanaerobium polyolivorans]MCC3145706.1 hypothetical protein [Halanaerobium polyolivorans]RQD77474.1 MAG: hypothetical protein D5S01_02590 [Halanaerobium sp. MSAO_Bac5]
MRNDCCWCGQDTRGGEVFSLSASFNEKAEDLAEDEGYIEELKLNDGREIWTIITGKKSPAKKQGQDMLFMCCSNNCARNLKQQLIDDKEFLDSIDFF